MVATESFCGRRWLAEKTHNIIETKTPVRLVRKGTGSGGGWHKHTQIIEIKPPSQTCTQRDWERRRLAQTHTNN
ncbi:MAG: hypothetical protein FWC97_03690 [Treponema sp.]|nr:hypothetical protein [Treponema sp.]